MATSMNTACRLLIRLLRLRLSLFGCLGFAVMAPQEPSHTHVCLKRILQKVSFCVQWCCSWGLVYALLLQEIVPIKCGILNKAFVSFLYFCFGLS